MQTTLTRQTDGIGIPAVVTATKIEKVEYLGVTKRERTRSSDPQIRSFLSKPRLYVSVKGESLWQNLARRGTSPVREYRKYLILALKELGLPLDTKAHWDDYAGCSMCRCSPGFVLDYRPWIDPKDRYLYWANKQFVPFDAWMEIGDRTE